MIVSTCVQSGWLGQSSNLFHTHLCSEFVPNYIQVRLFLTPWVLNLVLNLLKVIKTCTSSTFVLIQINKKALTRAVTWFSHPSVGGARVVTGSEEEARAPTSPVVFPGAGPSHGDHLLRRHAQVAASAAVCRQNCGRRNQQTQFSSRSSYPLQ